MDLKEIFESSEFIYTVSGDLRRGQLQSVDQEAAKGAEFYSVNPLDPNWRERAQSLPQPPITPRFALNVTKFRNFVFESDTGTLEEQLNEWIKLSDILPIKLLTFSGGKSYHAIISVIDELGFEPHTDSGVSAYKQAWKGLKGFIEANTKLRLDNSTKDPSRLTRIPSAVRANGNVQTKIHFERPRYISAAGIMEIMAQYAPIQTFGKRAAGAPVSTDSLLKLLKQPRNRHLYNKIENPAKWASTENMYPAILRLTLWAIDEINPEPQAWLALMESKVFPVLKALGYPRDLTIGVRNAYAYKGLPFL